ncbi:MAG: hypothetical protein P1S60_11520 [Anaerolineae bacterium]|nr:hypothetical protein [Anaerolineae bacterium]
MMNKVWKIIAILGLTILIFIWGAYQQARLVSTDMHAMDQSAYLDYAKNLAQTNLSYTGGRNRMPLYPMLMSFFYQDGLSDTVFFEKGKVIGIGISLMCLGISLNAW